MEKKLSYNQYLRISKYLEIFKKNKWVLIIYWENKL